VKVAVAPHAKETGAQRFFVPPAVPQSIRPSAEVMVPPTGRDTLTK
jgi:hypothetical protein